MKGMKIMKITKITKLFVGGHLTQFKDHFDHAILLGVNNYLIADVIDLVAAQVVNCLALEGGQYQVAEKADAQVGSIADSGRAGGIVICSDKNMNLRDLAEVVAALAGGIGIMIGDEGEGRVSKKGVRTAADGANLVTPVVGGLKDQGILVFQGRQSRNEPGLDI